MSQQFSKLFVSPDEQTVAVLGNNTAQAFFSSGMVGNGFAILSNRRVYFRGKCFALEGHKLNERYEERVVDAQDVTGTGFVHINPVWLAILAGIGWWAMGATTFIAILMATENEKINVGIVVLLNLVFLAIALAFHFAYKSKRKNLFEILFAGGGIAFNVSWFPKEEAEYFQRAIKQVSDARKEEMRAQPAAPSGSSADELNKLANLLQQGLITREEFEQQKARLFGTR